MTALVHLGASPDRRGLTASAAAQYVGVSPATFARRVKHGDLPPPVCVAGARRWDRAALDALFDGSQTSNERNEWD